MAFSAASQEVAGAAGVTTTATISAPSAGDLIVAVVAVDTLDAYPAVLAPDGFTLDATSGRQDSTQGVYSKVSDGAETELSWVNEDAGGDTMACIVTVFPSSGGASFVPPEATSQPTSVAAATVGPVTAENGDLLIATRAAGSASIETDNWSDGFTDTVRSNYSGGGRAFLGYKLSSGGEESTTHTATNSALRNTAVLLVYRETTSTSIRKSSTFDIETELSGTVTDATLDGNAITVDSQDGTTVTLTDSDGSITTSGEYDLVLTDDSADPDETITVQVNVYGVVPSDNPWQKDGSALADLTNVQYRVVAGADLNGTELHYTGTGATDASGNIPTFDVSDSAAEVDDTVHIVALSDAGESIVATETVELI